MAKSPPGRSKRLKTSENSRTYGGRTGRAKNFEPDYSYVIKDLKRIGLIAGSFIAILVVLSLFLK